ncbi:hypothetical protein ACFY2D_24460 [Streptomyces nigra]|uniref:hypothetical protein n=1 Tax=Streptomyces nigra TaxID=1827580 RepID=UPI0036B5102D
MGGYAAFVVRRPPSTRCCAPGRMRGVRRLAATVDEVLRPGRRRGLRRLAATANDVPRAPDGRAAFVA